MTHLLGLTYLAWPIFAHPQLNQKQQPLRFKDRNGKCLRRDSDIEMPVFRPFLVQSMTDIQMLYIKLFNFEIGQPITHRKATFSSLNKRNLVQVIFEQVAYKHFPCFTLCSAEFTNRLFIELEKTRSTLDRYNL